ncbi:MAG: photosynthetic complex assembly protein PuhC [Hyphomicrobiaceae bacterium]|nr:photosynthetic complex assembly protein PuhC [Hyphomicrobiaceae bacterium]
MADAPFPPIPRAILLAAAALACGVIVVAGTARTTDIGVSRVEYAAPAARRDVRFADQPDGSVAVSDANSNEVVAVLEPGTNGFVRIMMRSLAKHRQDMGIGAEPAFALTRWDDGRLSILDPVTGQHRDLSGFGKTNVNDFAKLLLAGRASQ